MVEIQGESIWADGAMERDEHLPLLGTPNTLYCAYQPGALRHKKLLMVVRVIIGRQHDQDWSSQPTVDVICDDTLENCSLEDSV